MDAYTRAKTSADEAAPAAENEVGATSTSATSNPGASDPFSWSHQRRARHALINSRRYGRAPSLLPFFLYRGAGIEAEHGMQKPGATSRARHPLLAYLLQTMMCRAATAVHKAWAYIALEQPPCGPHLCCICIVLCSWLCYEAASPPSPPSASKHMLALLALMSAFAKAGISGATTHCGPHAHLQMSE